MDKQLPETIHAALSPFISTPQDISEVYPSMYIPLLFQHTLQSVLTINTKSSLEWKPQNHPSFPAYLSQAVWAWANATELSLFKLFDGSDASIDVLTTLISNGKLTPGSRNGRKSEEETPSGVAHLWWLQRTFYTYFAPAVWANTPELGVFVLDSGQECEGSDGGVARYLSRDVANDTRVCYNGRVYYLVSAQGDAKDCRQGGECGDGGCIGATACADNLFSKPPEFDKLLGGRISVGDVIAG